MLPNESLLQVLHFADYKTLVLAKLAGARFLRVAAKYAAELARRRIFRVRFYNTCITYLEVTIDARYTSIRYEDGNLPSLVAACRELDGVVGAHAVGNLMFSSLSTWNMPGVGVIFEAAPPLKYADEVEIYGYNGASIDSEAFMSNFSGTKALRLWLDNYLFRQFSWTFLRQESARELRLIKFTISSDWTDDMNRAVENIVLNCVTLPRLLGGEPLELDFSVNDYSGAFGQRIIELLKGTGCELTIRMKTLREGELVLDERDYTVDVDGNTTRYVSEKSGIVVEVEGRFITIQSTAAVPRKKPRTSGEVLPVIPLVE